MVFKELSTVKEKYFPTKVVKFNRNKHKKIKWMTNQINMKLINSKDNLCKQSCEISVHISFFL